MCCGRGNVVHVCVLPVDSNLHDINAGSRTKARPTDRTNRRVHMYCTYISTVRLFCLHVVSSTQLSIPPFLENRSIISCRYVSYSAGQLPYTSSAVLGRETQGANPCEASLTPKTEDSSENNKETTAPRLLTKQSAESR
jgi:hypothetical protein